MYNIEVSKLLTTATPPPPQLIFMTPLKSDENMKSMKITMLNVAR